MQSTLGPHRKTRAHTKKLTWFITLFIQFWVGYSTQFCRNILIFSDSTSSISSGSQSFKIRRQRQRWKQFCVQFHLVSSSLRTFENIYLNLGCCFQPFASVWHQDLHMCLFLRKGVTTCWSKINSPKYFQSHEWPISFINRDFFLWRAESLQCKTTLLTEASN